MASGTRRRDLLDYDFLFLYGSGLMGGCFVKAGVSWTVKPGVLWTIGQRVDQRFVVD